MNQQSTLDQLQELKLSGMAKRYEAIIMQPVHQQPEPHELIATLTEAEAGYRVYQRTQLYLRLAKLRYNATLEQINCRPERGITKEILLTLSDAVFIEKSENLLITGATGCGKSYLACAMGRNACLLGHRTLYYSMNRFIEALASARLDGTYIRWLNVIAKMPLLIIDDWGLQPLSHDMKLTILQILEDRFAKGATIITSQLPVNKWYEYINEPTLADAICDRLTANAHKIELKGESLRKNKNS
ncbi:ATP-binding protein [Chitinophaga oryziterrae]|uniref:ATP-binding protein n=1 Tax=Chitinophaga oryziterrae TaxID=1031224 RepID=A0A6N8JLF8_9BACT|nr:IS21-like element helper ATPase IstB [Chitinophaga oryziterrae]MVT45216.1 ATP-binding protein [Chitinophaga oryziterrae]